MQRVTCLPNSAAATSLSVSPLFTILTAQSHFSSLCTKHTRNPLSTPVASKTRNASRAHAAHDVRCHFFNYFFFVFFLIPFFVLATGCKKTRAPNALHVMQPHHHPLTLPSVQVSAPSPQTQLIPSQLPTATRNVSRAHRRASDPADLVPATHHHLH